MCRCTVANIFIPLIPGNDFEGQNPTTIIRRRQKFIDTFKDIFIRVLCIDRDEDECIPVHTFLISRLLLHTHKLVHAHTACLSANLSIHTICL